MPVPAVLAPIVPQVILAETPAGVVTSVAGGTTVIITAQGSATALTVYTDANGNGPTTTPSLDSKGQLLQTSGAPWFVVPGSYLCTPNVAGGVPTGIEASVPLPTAAQVGADAAGAAAAVTAASIGALPAPTTAIPAWAAATLYALGQQVTRDGYVWSSSALHTSGAIFSGAANWVQLGLDPAGNAFSPPLAVRSVMANTTARDGELLLVDTTAGALTVTLAATPAAVTRVVKVSADANVLTINPPASKTINGQTSAQTSTPFTGGAFGPAPGGNYVRVDGPGGGVTPVAGQVIGSSVFTPASVSNATTNSGTLVDATFSDPGATTPSVAFAAPPSGRVKVRALLMLTLFQGNPDLMIGLREAAAAICNPRQARAAIISAGSILVDRTSYEEVISGLVPGSAHTYKLAIASNTNGTATGQFSAGPGQPLIMEAVAY